MSLNSIGTPSDTNSVGPRSGKLGPSEGKLFPGVSNAESPRPACLNRLDHKPISFNYMWLYLLCCAVCVVCLCQCCLSLWVVGEPVVQTCVKLIPYLLGEDLWSEHALKNKNTRIELFPRIFRDIGTGDDDLTTHVPIELSMRRDVLQKYEYKPELLQHITAILW